jgi:predicted NAD-dependent protein-ADP-ribosyltransferase YbiA (DUF1768 family)
MSKLIHYDINEQLENEDIGLDVPLYSVEFYEKEYLISLGKERQLKTKKNTYYFPIYLIHKNQVFKQIGVFEFESTDKNPAKAFLDKDGDVDIRKLSDPILYPFANREFFETSTLSVSKADISQIEDHYAETHKTESSNIPVGEHAEEEIESLDDPFALPANSSSSASIAAIQKTLQQGPFDHDPAIVPPPHLPEEMNADAIALKKEFKISGTAQWIEKFMRNNEYDIVETMSNGDCLFDVVRIAFLQIGHRTTLAKLRAMVAEEADESVLEFYKLLYKEEKEAIEEWQQNMRDLKMEQSQIKKRIEKMDAQKKKQELAAVKPRIAEIAEKYKEYSELVHQRLAAGEFDFMKGIETLDQLREHMQKSSYWADEWTIGVLERKLNIKLIIFAEDKYTTGDLNSILENPATSKNKGVFQCSPAEVKNPQYYIMTSYSGDHYRLITYKTKYIFTFSELPYDVKMLVTIKCMEKKNGAYSQISSFRHFQTKLGIALSPLEELEQEQEEDSSAQSSSDEKPLYDPATVFVFYNKSSPTPKPGKGSGEEIPVGKVAEYSALTLKKNADWRKKLDDEWPAEFKVDQLKWYSVEHYYQGSKFKKMHPDFYRMFSMDSGSDFAEDVVMARIAGSKSGKHKDKLLRPDNIKIDSDFYGERRLLEREKSVFAKFSQNAELGEILRLTKDAKLVKYIAKKPAEPDTILMKVRQVLNK